MTIIETQDYKCTSTELLLSIPEQLLYLTDMSLEERTEFLYDVNEAFKRVNKILQHEIDLLNDKHMFI
jgi:hypothetical protein